MKAKTNKPTWWYHRKQNWARSAEKKRLRMKEQANEKFYKGEMISKENYAIIMQELREQYRDAQTKETEGIRRRLQLKKENAETK